MSNLFQGAKHAQGYSLYRPTYPKSVFESIIRYCKEGSVTLETAIDVGCGSGQSTVPLAKYFSNVVGVDISEAQISQAPKDVKGVCFQVGKGEDLSFQPDNSVDLVTCAQGLHWLDTAKFYPEVKRVLRSHGALACYGYGTVRLCSKEATEVVLKYHNGTLYGKGFWDERRHHVDENYAQFSFPMADWTRKDDLTIEKCMKLVDFVGYLSTWSGYQTLKKQHPDSTVLTDLHAELKKIYVGDDPEVHVCWPIFILFGRQE